MLWAKVFQIEDEMSQEEEKIKRTKREIEKLSSMTQGNAVQQRELKENQEQIQRQLREIKQEFEQSQVNKITAPFNKTRQSCIATLVVF